ncbi:deoxyribodipyrimidine photolyase [Fimicolochytrium jonesii]|uniref:deoxyribodipyrimidine photolyase n=1 Tax=Fimicolochytrium jonesii TaxID=1396493 RepID=UPI0022FEB13B|nr:deoxyribodipyrimidine photolyase [Fimicolochytrium jonesii]KAI8822939.1 deoxyribodipyrimidine photolyase [Fimicolochytrium jonesii]
MEAGGEGVSLVWFKMDLRTKDNPALSAATQCGLPVVAMFLVNVPEWVGHDMAPIRAEFIMRNLDVLKGDLAALNIPLIIQNVAGKADDACDMVVTVAQTIGAKKVFFNIEFEVNEKRRDAKTRKILEGMNIEVHPFQDQCIVDPGTVRTNEGRVYTVFSPFKRKWYSIVHDNPHLLQSFPDPTPNQKGALQQSILTYADQHSTPPKDLANLPYDPEKRARAASNFPAGEHHAQSRLQHFIDHKSKVYHTTRDNLTADGTSSLSPYLSNGVLTIRQCVAAAVNANKGRLDSGDKGLTKWVDELVWREFYRHILVEFPRVSMSRPFKLETEAIPWLYDEEVFRRWCEGRTGYPIVDAGMRQLSTVGWMHNRTRMITAMFLTKDLLINWQHGERFFMQHLIDGDLANNNGGWQWSASTGVDPQPYFRIFNPRLQSVKCDPDGSYIRTWVPELGRLRGKAVHDPYGEMPRDAFMKLGYPAPIVDHKFARDRCLQVFKKALKKG